MIIVCVWCGAKSDKPTGAVNRARNAGLPLYCNRICVGLGRRKGKTSAQLKAEKRAYDQSYRETNRATLKAKKRAYHAATYDLVAAAEYRKSRMPLHIEYCRRPEYRKWKAAYDKGHLAEKQYGPAAEAMMLLRDLEQEIRNRANGRQIRQDNRTINKRQNRTRADARTVGRSAERDAMGHTERDQV